MALIDITGHRFGRLTVTSRADKPHPKQTFWNCICDCGNERIVRGDALRAKCESGRGVSRSCGCLQKEKAVEKCLAASKHGMTKTRAFKSWAHIRQRCNNPDDAAFDRYGGRGITICNEWDEFAQFYADMGDPPIGASIDRIDNSKGYSPGNCRWATDTEQSRNRRNSIYIPTEIGVYPVREYAEMINMSYNAVRARVQRGTLAFVRPFAEAGQW